MPGRSNPGIRNPALAAFTAEQPAVRQGPGPTQPALPDGLPPGIMRAYRGSGTTGYSLPNSFSSIRTLLPASRCASLLAAPLGAGRIVQIAPPRRFLNPSHEPSIRSARCFLGVIRLFEETRNAERNSMAPVQPGRDSAKPLGESIQAGSDTDRKAMSANDFTKRITVVNAGWGGITT